MPSGVLVRPTACAANRKVVATRLITLQVRVSSSLRPLILLRGERPSHEQNALALRHLLMSTPISETMSNTLKTLSPMKQSSQRDSLRDRTRASPMLSPQNQRNRALQRAFKAPLTYRSWLPSALCRTQLHHRRGPLQSSFPSTDGASQVKCSPGTDGGSY